MKMNKMSHKIMIMVGEILRDLGIGIVGGAIVSYFAISNSQYGVFIVMGAIFTAIGNGIKMHYSE